MIIYICELRAQMISFTDIAGTGTITVTLQCSFRSTCSKTSVTKCDRYGHALTVSIIAIFSQSVLYDIISILLENNCSDRSLELYLPAPFQEIMTDRPTAAYQLTNRLT